MTLPPMAMDPGGLKPLGDYIHSKGLKCGPLLTLIICLGPVIHGTCFPTV
jgi:hypothetical protein